MSEQIVECVPNFSEGRDPKKIELILNAIRDVDGVRILDVDAGFDTHRTVVTLVGAPEPIKEAAFRAIARASEVIDMSVHKGAHPRHGATDVCPFIPVAGVTMEDCAEYAKQLGERVGEELKIPVYLYDHAALRPERRSLAHVRKGEYEALEKKMKDPAFAPDFGPALFNPKTGVVTIGAREFLIAYNVNLNTRRKDHATDLAFEIREKGRAVRVDPTTGYYASGQLRCYRPSKNRFPCAYDSHVAASLSELEAHYRDAHGMDLGEEFRFHGQNPEKLEGEHVMKRGTFKECRAVGWVIPEYDKAQITINLTNFRVTPAHAVLEECRRLATDRGIVVTGSEIVGVVPYEAMRESGEFYLQQQGSSRGLPTQDVIETAVQSMGLRDVGEFDAAQGVLGLPSTDGELASMRLNDFADEVSRPTPAPGGGSIAALAGSLGAALVSMVANLTFAKRSKRRFQASMEEIARECQGVKDQLLRGVDADTAAFNSVLDAFRLPQGNDEEKAKRREAIETGYKKATSVPFDTAQQCLAALELCRRVVDRGLESSITDAAVGAHMARTGLEGAIMNVRINLGSIRDKPWVKDLHGKLQAMRQQGDQLLNEILEVAESKMPRID